MLNSIRRVYLITENCLRESIRQKIFYAILFISIGMITGIYFLRELNFGSSEINFIFNLGYGTILLFGSILTITISAQLFFSEIENRNAITILAKPIRKSEFILGKFLGIIILLALFTGIMISILILVLKFGETKLLLNNTAFYADERLLNYTNLIIYSIAQWLKFVMICAITILVSSYSQTIIFSTVSSFLILTICQLQYLARITYSSTDFIPLNWFVAMISYLFPNFQIFNLGEHGATSTTISLMLMVKLLLYTTIYSSAYLYIATICFSRREI